MPLALMALLAACDRAERAPASGEPKDATTTSSMALAFACRPDDAGFLGPHPEWVRITPADGEQAHFYSRYDCPSSNGCTRSSLVTRGEELFVAYRDGEWACAWAADEKQMTWGYLRAVDLSGIEQSAPTLQDWIGEWTSISPADRKLGVGDNRGTLTFREVDGGLAMQSHAFFDTAPWAEQPGPPREGRFSGVVELDGFHGIVPIKDKAGCDIRLVRIAEVIVAVEEGCVGGINVHTGIYRRRPTEP